MNLENILPRGGNTKILDISKEYILLIKEGYIPAISENLIGKLKQHYNINIFNDNNEIQPILRAAEELSKNPKFTNSIGSKLTIEELYEKVISFYPTIQIKGKLSTIMLNFSAYFNIINQNDELKNEQRANINSDIAIKNPFVFLDNKFINPDDFITVNKTNDKNKINVYSVNEEYLPKNISRIYTDDNRWKKVYVGKNYSNLGKENNWVIIEYKKNINNLQLNKFMDEIRSNDPHWLGINPGYDKVLLKEQIYSSAPKGKNYSGDRIALAFDNQNKIGVNFFQLRSMLQAMTAEGGMVHHPLIKELQALNKMQSYLENRL